MIRFGKFALLIVPLVIGCLAGSSPGRAQGGSAARFAFADTTLLRDTLGIRFTGLFPLADSLGVLPDTLRALAVRYLFTPTRLVHLADSLHVPVDSVGVVLERERFNPLARSGERVNTLLYNTTYSVQRTSSQWRNASDYNFGVGPIFVRNTSTIQLERYTSAGRLSLRQTRESNTEGGWKLSPNFSIGGRADLSRFDSSDPSSISNVGETRNEVKLSMRTRQQPRAGLSSEFNVLSGVLDLSNSSQEKRGLAGDMSGKIRYELGNWLVNEINGQSTGNFARTRLPGAFERFGTNDLTNHLRGALSLFQSGPAGLNVNYSMRNNKIETPVAGPQDSLVETPEFLIQRLQTDNSAFDATMRLRQDNDRFINFTQRIGTNNQANATGQNTTRDDETFDVDSRYLLWGWSVEGRFSNLHANSTQPRVTATGGYRERSHNRSLDGGLNRALTRHLVTRLLAGVGVTSYRYSVLGVFANLPVTRDQYRQNYRLETAYTPSDRFNTTVSLDVSRNQLLNLPSASVAANNETRTYRAEWRWSYRLLRGLTATQHNSVSANYTYLFQPENNRLSLDYLSRTNLNAILSRTLTVDITHNSQEQPSGNYRAGDGGFDYFFRADESQSYTLDANIAYTPAQAFSINIAPRYRASNRDVTVDGETTPQRRSRNLTFTGRANLNLRVGGKGRLSGDIGRTFTADRSTTYQSGAINVTPVTETDFWNGSLQFSWEL
ncbi:MAG TPA: hypothetical protein VEY91_07150 [Candidatus Limnocylindria bacterium]|nr:hypothetical protein [Candidatus Limnocylindria bacterium]